MVRVLFTISAVIIFVFGGLLGYLGAFSKVEVKESTIGPYHLVYEANTGDYRQTGTSVDSLMKLAATKGVVPVAGFGIYMDDPNEVPKEKLRSEAGIIIQPQDVEKFKGVAAPAKYRMYPQTSAVVSEFPLKNFLSIFLGIYKVYPAIMDYMKAKNYKISYSFEIYEMNNRTVYAFPILQ